MNKLYLISFSIAGLLYYLVAYYELLGLEWNPYSALFFLILISLYAFAYAFDWWKGNR